MRLFEYHVTNGWTLLTQTEGPTANGKFGTSVSISGDGGRLAVGAPGTGSMKGEVYTYDYSPPPPACGAVASPPPPPLLPPPPARPPADTSDCSCTPPSAPEPEHGGCSATGDPHYFSFHGVIFDFYARGLYEHARFRIEKCGCEVVMQTLNAKLTRGKVCARTV